MNRILVGQFVDGDNNNAQVLNRSAMLSSFFSPGTVASQTVR